MFPIKITHLKYSPEHHLVFLLFVNKWVKHSIIGQKDLSRVVIFVSLNGNRHNLKRIYFFQDCMKVGGFQLPWAAGVYIISFMLPWELTMPAALLPAARSISFFSQGKNCLQYLKKLRRHLFQNYFMHATGTFCRKDQQPHLKYQSETIVSSDVTVLTPSCYFHILTVLSHPNYISIESTIWDQTV